MPKGKGYGGNKMPNEGTSRKGDYAGGKASPSMSNASGPRKTNDQRADVLKSPSSKNPYPHGLA